MSPENVEIVRRHIEAYLGPEPESALAFLDPNVEFDLTERPEGRVWHGHEGVRRAMVEWTGAWRNWGAQMERYFELPEEQVLALWREWGEGKGSGIPMKQEGGHLYTLRDGLIVRMKAIVGRSRALEAAGLSE